MPTLIGALLLGMPFLPAQAQALHSGDRRVTTGDSKADLIGLCVETVVKNDLDRSIGRVTAGRKTGAELDVEMDG